MCKKIDTFCYAILHENFKLTFKNIQKASNLALREVFIYKKKVTLKKRENLCYAFIYKNPDTLRYTIFHGMFVIGGGVKYFFN